MTDEPTGPPPVRPPVRSGLHTTVGRGPLADLLDDPIERARRASIRAQLFGEAVPELRVGRYRLVRRLGAGATGVVHLAHDDALDRPVALKLLRGGSGASEVDDARRMLREAQALARLSHPNVVAVYEAGIDDEHAWVVMELIDGTTLRAWQVGRSHAEILAAYLQAAAGLAAAHDAGIVHRDFKPENVMIGRDGRVRVLDFGLARGLADVADESSQRQLHDLDRDALVDSLTATGALVGTPAYMAPEQLAGTRADERSDQFAFCVALFEALHGERPYAGTTASEVFANIAVGNMRAVPRVPGVPRHVLAALRRGLARDSANRWPSIYACMAALQRQSRSRATGGLVVLAAIAGGALVLVPDADPTCPGAADRLDAVWNRKREAEIAARFDGARAVAVRDRWPQLRERIDEYAVAWTEAYSRACSETAGRLRTRRMECLDRGLVGLGAVLDLLGSGGETLDRSAELVAGLEPVERCGDDETLPDALDLPGDRALAESVEQTRRAMIVAHAQVRAGHLAHAAVLFEQALADARRLGWPPLVARAAYWTATVADEREQAERAQALYEEAYELALASGRDEIAALSASHLTTLLGYARTDFQDAQRWARNAEAAIERMGRPNRVEADLDNNLGLVAMARGEIDTARQRFRRSIEIYRELGAPYAVGAASPLQNLAQIAYLEGNHSDAQALLGESLEVITADGRGGDHPDALSILINRAVVRIDLARFDEAESDLLRALAASERTLGPTARTTASVLINLGMLELERGRWSEALAYNERALDVLEHGVGVEHVSYAHALSGAGEAMMRMGRTGDGEAALARALALVESLYGPEHDEVADVEHALGRALVDDGRARDATAHLERAYDIVVRVHGSDSPRAAEVAADLAQAKSP